MKSAIYRKIMLATLFVTALGAQAQEIIGYSGLFNFNTKYKISGTVTNVSNGLPVAGATVRSLTYSSLPSATDGSFSVFVPPGYGYTVFAAAQNFTTKYVYNVHVLQDNPESAVNFQLVGQDSFLDYRFSELAQAPNPGLLEIPKGGTGYAWFVVEGEVSPGVWLPVPNAIIGVIDGQGNPVLNKNGQAIQSNQFLYSFLTNPLHVESYGHFSVPVKSSIIQDGTVGQQELFTIMSVNGQAVSSANQTAFTAKVVPYEIAKSWGFRVYAKGGVGAGSITGIARGNAFAGGGMGSGLKVKFDNPDNTNDWSAFQVTRKFDLFGGISAKVGPPDLLAVDADISTGITASFPYQGEYDFDIDNIAGLEAALAFYLFYEPTILLGGSALPGGQIGVAFLSWLVQALIANQGQNGLGIARISDAAGLDIKGHINADVGVGFGSAESLKLGMNTSLGANAHFGAFIKHENFSNIKNSIFYLGGGYDLSFTIGPKLLDQNNVKSKFMYPFRMNQLLIPSQLDVEFGFTNVKQNDVWQRIDLEAALESNSGLLNIYNLPGQRQKYTAKLSVDQQDVRNWLLNVAEIPNELTNIGTSAVNVAIDNNSFKNDVEKFLEKIYEEQNNDAPVLLDYQLKAEDKNEYAFDLTLQFPLPVFPAIDIVIGGGLEANNVTEYDLAEGFWVKGYPYLRTELPNPVNPYLSFNNVMNELWQNVISKDIWEELKNVIIAQISNSKFIKWFSGKSNTQLVLLNEKGSTLEIRQNSIPSTIDSMYCRQWDWNQEPTRALTDTKMVSQYKQYAKAVRNIREEAVGMRYGIGGFYKFEPSTGSFTDSTKLTIAYTDTEIDGFDENSLAMYWEDSLGVWRHIPSYIEPDSNRVSAWIKHFATYTLAPRMPFGDYILQSQPDSLPSDGSSVALIYSPVLLNNDSSMIAENSLFTIEISRGTILTADIAPDITGIQIAVQNGIISFEMVSDSVATPIYLSARSVTGYAICEGILKLYDTIAPTAPQNLSAVAGLNSAFISWEKVNDADVVGYKIYYDTDTIAPLSGIHTVAGEPSPIETGIGTNQNIIGLFNDSTYYFAVSAVDISGNESQRSAFASAIPFSCLPIAPSNISVENITSSSAEIEWQANGVATEWDLTFGPQGFDTITEGTLLTGITNQPVELNNLIPISQYNVYMRAVCGGDIVSEWSQPVSFETFGNITISASAGTGGSIEPNGMIQVEYNSDQSFIISPEEGFAINDVLVDGESVGAVNLYTFLNVAIDHSIEANFTQNPINHTITTSSNPTAGGTTTGAGTYQNGQSCTLTATANNGYTFSNWTEGGNIVSTDANYIFTVTGNRTLVANFSTVSSTDAIPLKAGWNLISLDVIPQNAQVTTVFSSLIGSNNLVEVKSFHGQQEVVYKPSNPSGSNTLTALVPGLGYWVKVVDAAILTVEGSAIPEDFAINLNAGWNLIGYWPQQSGTVTAAMQQLINAGILEGISGFETEGKFFDPQAPVFLNTLETISNSKAYWLKLSSAFNNFKYNESTGNNDGLVAYFPFNGNAQDESGNANHGVVNGATLTEDRFGNSGSAYNFAGISNPQTITVASSNSLQFTDAATFSFWVNMNDYQGMDGWGGTTDYGYHAVFAREMDYYMHGAISGIPDGRFQAFFGSGANGIGCYDTVPASSLNSWHHIVYVITSSNVSIYANGNMIASENGSLSFSSSNDKDLWFGRLIETWYPFNGKMDDIRIYNRVLSPFEISELYHEGGWPLPDLNTGLVAYYPFNGNTQDESGTGNNGTIIGNVSMTTDRFGNANSAYDFPGLPFNYINVPHSESLSLDTMTMVAWIYTETDYGHGQIIQKNRDIESGHYGLYTESINGTVSYGNNVYAAVYESPEIGSWHMVAGILSGNTAQFYVDGILIADTVAPSVFTYSGTQPLAIGMHYFDGVPDYWTYPYKGKLDDLRIYNRVLSPFEISELYHEGGWPLPDLNDGLVAYYPFNGNANDESGNEYHGNIQNQTAFNPGISGNGIHLTGACASSYYCTGETGGHVLLPYIDFNAMDAFTISLWAKEEEMLIVDGEAYIVFGNSSESSISIMHSGNMQFTVGNQTIEHPFDNNDLNQWVHWLMKFENGQLTAYKNGAAIGELSGISYNITSQLQAIGRHWWYLTSTRYTGMIDEVRIYERALSEAEIEALYSIEQSFVCGSPFTDTRDGKTYNSVQIGDQCWMQENLSYLPVVSPPNQGSENDPFYYVYGYQGSDINEAKVTENYQNYGVLYNWPASLAACPAGWHLPGDAEWTALTDHLGGEDIAGGKLKSTRTAPETHPRWESPNAGATNESNFSGIPGGNREIDGTFILNGTYGWWWSSTEQYITNTKYRMFQNVTQGVAIGSCSRAYGFSVRCVKDNAPQVNIPTINTTEVTGITDNTATAGGMITSDGGAPLSARGLCFNTSGNPTIDDGYTLDDSGSDSFSNTLSGLNPETNYYLRAYATNAAGTAYGNEISFTTESAPFNCGETLTDGRDGKTYATIKIGNQCWMQTNLKAGTLLSLPNYPSDNNTIERWALNNDINIGDTHGSFYTWNELMNYQSNESNQGICPDGWHIPTLDEFTVLIDLYGGTSFAGGAMKHNGASGFNATMLGMVDFNPGFYGANFSSFYWTSTPVDNGAYNISVLQSGPSVFIQNSTPQTGYLAKCIKNPCTAPTSANAGPDQTNLSSTTTLLAANAPIIGNGIWSIIEGDGGSVDEVSNPVSIFSGISGTTYKLVWTITNTCGDISADTVLIAFAQNLNIGDSYGGGIIAYIFQQGDPGYIEGEQHGLIAASIDQGDAQWYVTSYPYITYPPTGATANTLGTGNANTTAIVGIQGIGNYAAKLCYDLVLEGYSDWYLPSKDELGKLYINKSAIGGFSYTAAYWSSSESIDSADNAWFQHFSDGSWYDYIKYNACNIRAVRSF